MRTEVVVSYLGKRPVEGVPEKEPIDPDPHNGDDAVVCPVGESSPEEVGIVKLEGKVAQWIPVLGGP